MILKANPESLSQAVHALKKNECVGMPTETVYGLAGNGLEPVAIARIFETKERPTFDPLILHISPSMLPRIETWVTFPSPELKKTFEICAQAFWPGPLTMLFQKKPIVPDLATSGLPEVAIRMPSHPVAISLIDAFGGPLAAPSANKFGSMSPTRAAHVEKELGDRISIILDGDASAVGVESTVIRILPNKIEILRPGGVSAESLTQATTLRTEFSMNPHSTLSASPGTLENHYAPQTPLLILPRKLVGGPVQELKNWVHDQKKKFGAKNSTLILFSESHADKYESGGVDLFEQSICLSEKGKPSEIASNLFSILRQTDESGTHIIFVEPVTEATGLWPAIHDRFSKAARK